MKVREGFVESHGHRLAYLAVNEHLASDDQPAIIFIHGVLASVNFWRDCVPASFREQRAWYALSLPAHHPSTVSENFASQDLDEQWFYDITHGAITALLGSRKVIVIGHSTGGFCALNLAIRRAPNVIGIVSIAGFHSGNWGGVEGLLVKLAAAGSWARSLFAFNIWLAKKSAFVQRRFASLLACDRQAYLASPLSQKMIDNIRANVRSQDSSALFYLFRGINRLEIAEQLNDISIPCHLLAGTHDPVVPAEQSLLLAGAIKRVKTVVFQNVGHMPFMEATEVCMAAIEGAVNDIASQYRRYRIEADAQLEGER
mgnify:CR=1 FL=1